MKRRLLLLCSLTLIVLLGVLAYWRLTANPPKEGDNPLETKPVPPVAAKEETEEEKTRRQLLGVWKDEYQGKRTMTINDDGSATMLVELSGVNAFLAGANKLRFDMKWSLDGKKLTKRSLGGEPANKVNAILNLKGNTAEETILELDEQRLLLLDKDGTTKYDWKRVPKEEASKQ